jgi:hypothetical protein
MMQLHNKMFQRVAACRPLPRRVVRLVVGRVWYQDRLLLDPPNQVLRFLERAKKIVAKLMKL